MKLLILLFLFLCGLVFFVPVGDTDFGWHLRCGADLLAGRPCLVNSYSYYLDSYRFAYPSFIYDGLLAVVFNRFGFLGLSLVGSILFAAICAVVLRFSRLPFWLTMPGLLLATALSWSVLGLGLRPQVITVFFVVITISILQNNLKFEILNLKSISNIKFLKIETFINFKLIKNCKLKIKNWGWAVYVLLTFVLWVNTHSGFWLGPVLVGLWAVAEVVDRFIKISVSPENNLILQFETHNSASLQYFKPAFLLLLSSVLVTFINPFGPAVWTELWQHFKTPLNTLIAEWVAPPWWHWVLIALLDGLFIWRSLKTKWSWFGVLVVLFMTVLALSARRNLPLYYFSLLLCHPGRRDPGSRNEIGPGSWVPARAWRLAGMTMLLVILVTSAYWRLPQTLAANSSWPLYCGTKYPCAAASFLKTLQAGQVPSGNLSGNVFANYEWGGFLIWQAPAFKVFVDGRTPAWRAPNGESPYTTYLKIIQAQKDWDKTLDKYSTNYLLISRGSFLDLELAPDPAKWGYKELYRDNLAVVYSPFPVIPAKAGT